MIRIEEAADDQLQTVADVWRSGYPLLPTSVAELAHDRTLDPKFRPRHWLAWDGESPVGLGILERNVGSYHPLKWVIYVAVPPERRKRGIGTTLFRAVMATIEATPLSILTRVAEDDHASLGFAARRGYDEVKRDFESELDLASAALGSLPYSTPDGIRLTTMREADSPEWRRTFYELFEEVRADTPRTDPPTPMDYPFFESNVIEAPDAEWDGTIMAFDGPNLVAFSTMFHGADEGRLDQGLTAVKRTHRGHGLATAMKAMQIGWARERGFRVIRTDNDTRNAPMLAVNEKLGFKRLKGMVTLMWQPLTGSK